MKKTLVPLFFGILTASQGLWDAPTFQASKDVSVTTNPFELLGNCTRLDFMFKECNWNASCALNQSGTISVLKAFRESPIPSQLISSYDTASAAEFSSC